MTLLSTVLSTCQTVAKLLLQRVDKSMVMLLCLSIVSQPLLAQQLSNNEVDDIIANSFLIRTSDLTALADNLDRLDQLTAQLTPQQRQQVIYLKAHQVAMKGNYKQAIILYKTLDNSEFLDIKVKSYSAQLNLQLIINNFRASNLLIDKLIESSALLDNKALINETYQMIAYYYNHINEFFLAENFINLTDQSILSPRLKCRFNHHKSLTLLGLGTIKGNDQFVRDSVAQCRQEGEQIIANSLLLENVRYLNLEEKYEEALNTLTEQDDYILAANFTPHFVMYFAEKSVAYLETQQIQLAKEFGLKTLSQDASIDGLKWRLTAFLTLSKVAEMEGDLTLAHQYLVTYEETNKDLVNLELQRQLGAAQAKHNYFGLLEKKKQVIQRYNQALAHTEGLDKKLFELRELSNHYLKIAAILSITLLISFMILLYIRLQRQGESNKSRLDMLTGLYSRTSFVDITSSVMYNMAKLAQPITMLTIDIDNFRGFNHQYGYHKGDELLIELAEILRSHANSWSDIGRMGSNDFAIVFPNKSLHEILKVCTSIQQHIQTIGKEIGLDTTSISVSMGISDSSLSEYAFKNYISDTSKALMKAKKLGGNQLVTFDLSMTKRHLYKNNDTNLKYVYEKVAPRIRVKSV